MSRSGSLLREVRGRAGLSQNELARRSGVDATLISAYENGRRVPGGDALIRLIEACGATLDPTTTVDRARGAAAQLEQVTALAMALPRRAAGPLTYPSFRRLRAG
ncbi:MAG TPA: helix-turn-helix transcriptional regulator [Mycobacteriales bacterium]|nr:helix-turn-helix transcriptional regulator [Mycobacteriales bacterium]